jgi:predicted AlkP superfamily pyrophosphatase or phosphodiesterase
MKGDYAVKNQIEKHFSGIERRAFLKHAATVLGGISIPSVVGKIFSPVAGTDAWAAPYIAARAKPEKLIFIAIDALHPAYFELDSAGNVGGHDGNWLMPNIRAFLGRSVWYPNARAFLPAATDMNHLNALAGTSSAQTGVIGVWAQPTGWGTDGRPIIQHSHISRVRDDHGRPVDTLFNAWKRRWPDSKTLLISGKEWVAEMFSQQGQEPAVDILVSGGMYPSYITPPCRESFADPLTDTDAACDPESGHKNFFVCGHNSSSEIMTRVYTGQGSFLTKQMERYPQHFPHDGWVVDTTLEIFRREDPDLAYILLAQCDDAGHCLGNAWDPGEFVHDITVVTCPGKLEQDLVSARNRMLVREAILDSVRDVDIQFGRLIEGFNALGISPRIVLLSDHSTVNHIATDDFSSTDVMGLLEQASISKGNNIFTFSVSSYGVLYWRDDKSQVSKAKQILLAHLTHNPQTGARECPWWVLDRTDMRSGVADVCMPGELYHQWFIDKDAERTMIWPDLIVLAKNGWQIPAYNGHVPNVGVNAPSWTPPWRVYNGGHGSVDTLPIVAAISIPGVKCGINPRPIRIADLGVTAANICGLQLRSTTVGQDLHMDLS